MKPKRHVIPVFVPHLGCPNDCVFCNQRRISGRYEPATPDTVRRVLENLPDMPEDGQKQLAFFGGSFTAISVDEQAALLEAAQPFLEKNKNAGLRISTRPDCIDRETLLRLKSFGVNTIELGAQSMCEDVLRASERGHTAQDTVVSSRLIQDAGFELIIQMMTGLPEDTPEKSLFTARRIIELNPDGVRIYPTVVIRDTRLHEMWLCGEYSAHTVEDAVTLCAAIYELFEEAGIPIIRLGLNPTDELSGGDAICGAYHPALGELVLSRVWLDRARKLLKDKGNAKRMTLGVSPKYVSIMTGHKRSNLSALCEEFGFGEISVTAADIKPGEIVIMCIEMDR
jgi:histone acetyltransferase (RNA polymerase elongator complex component)